jgi:hypothetical protein
MSSSMSASPNPIHSVEAAKVLVDMGHGLLNRIYHTKGKILSSNEKCYQYLMDPNLAKLRGKMGKKYVTWDQAALRQIPGGKQFIEKASDIASAFEFYDALLNVLTEFFSNTNKILIAFLTNIMDCNLGVNRPIMLLLLELMSVFMRVMWLFDRLIDNKIAMATMLLSATALNNPPPSSEQRKRTKELLNACLSASSLQKHFIDLFSSEAVQATLLSMLLKLRPSIELVSCSENLRKSGILNPNTDGPGAAGGKLVSLPSATMLYESSSIPDLVSPYSMYTEIMQMEAYYNYVIFSCLAAPPLLLEPSGESLT